MAMANEHPGIIRILLGCVGLWMGGLEDFLFLCILNHLTQPTFASGFVIPQLCPDAEIGKLSAWNAKEW